MECLPSLTIGCSTTACVTSATDCRPICSMPIREQTFWPKKWTSNMCAWNEPLRIRLGKSRAKDFVDDLILTECFQCRSLDKKYRDQIRLIQSEFVKEKESIVAQANRVKQSTQTELDNVHEQMALVRHALETLERVTSSISLLLVRVKICICVL